MQRAVREGARGRGKAPPSLQERARRASMQTRAPMARLQRCRALSSRMRASKHAPRRRSSVREEGHGTSRATGGSAALWRREVWEATSKGFPIRASLRVRRARKKPLLYRTGYGPHLEGPSTGYVRQLQAGPLRPATKAKIPRMWSGDQRDTKGEMLGTTTLPTRCWRPCRGHSWPRWLRRPKAAGQLLVTYPGKPPPANQESSGVAQELRNTCRTAAKKCPRIDQCWPTSTKLNKCWLNFCQIRQNWPNLAEVWPPSTNLGRS